MSDPKAQTPERKKTDGSLSVERKKADDALITSLHETEDEADREVETARAKIDRSVARDRAESALTLDTDDAVSGQVQEERRRADAHTADERDQADKTLQKERLERRSEEHALFAVQRHLTDESLRFERTRADQAYVYAAQLLTDEQVAHTATKDAVTTRDEFLAIVSHDLRSPLGIISMCADELAEACAGQRLTDQESQCVEIIRRQAATMSRLIVDLLDVEHMVSGKLKLSQTPCDLTALLQEVGESFQIWAAKKNIALTVGSPLPAMSVGIDRDRVWQVLSNLVGNALKFTPAGGTIAVGAEQSPTQVRVTVRDSGDGIAADQQGRIFERFSQLKKRDRRGVGLGLFIAKWIVEAHQGNIGVDSAVGGGSTFYFTLPRLLS